MYETTSPSLCRIKVAHLYPTVMDVHGDARNVEVLRDRGQRRGIAVDIEDVEVGDRTDLSDADLVFIGGGPDTAQTHVSSDLAARGPALRDLVEGGAACLAVGGGFQLFGNVHTTASGREIPGIGIFDVASTEGPSRHTGELVIETALGLPAGSALVSVAGFQDRAGVTELGPCVRPLGTVVESTEPGPANAFEGAVYGEAVGTYLHGPVLANSPGLADHLLSAALRHRYGRGALSEGGDEATPGSRVGPVREAVEKTDAPSGHRMAG